MVTGGSIITAAPPVYGHTKFQQKSNTFSIIGLTEPTHILTEKAPANSWSSHVVQALGR
jgi:hypothetical protein